MIKGISILTISIIWIFFTDLVLLILAVIWKLIGDERSFLSLMENSLEGSIAKLPFQAVMAVIRR